MSLLLSAPSYHVACQSTVPAVHISKENPEPEEARVYPLQMVQTLGYDVPVNLTSKALRPGQLWFVAGCARGLGGARQHKALAHVYGPFNSCIETERCNGTFRSGNGNTEQAMLLNNVPCLYSRALPMFDTPGSCSVKLPDAFMQGRLIRPGC